MQNAIKYQYQESYQQPCKTPLRLSEPAQEDSSIGRAMIIGMIVFIIGVIFCVVWEAAVARSLELKKTKLETTINNLDEQKRDIRATIARWQMPEEVVRLAMQDDVRFVAIDPKQAIRVGGAD